MRIFLLSTLVTLVTACASGPETSDSIKVAIGDSLKAHQYSDIYFSGQPSEKDYAQLKKQGFVSIVNLRQPSEHDEGKERALVEKSSMAYKNVPFSPKMSLSDEYIKKVTQAVVAHRKKGKVLVHCSSGNRVGIWLGGHFYKDHGYTKSQSLQKAKNMGLNNPSALEKLESYLESQ